MKISLIIPYYNTFEYTEQLLDELIKQKTNEVEIIVVDDGCNEKRLDKYQDEVKIIHLEQNSGSAGKPRNVGIENASGKYIGFIDSDDMVKSDYIKRLFEAIIINPDIVFISWESKAGITIMNTRPPQWNCAVWCRLYRRGIIGNIRFDEKMRIAEDYKFNEKIKYTTKVCIKKPIYIYNNGREGSLTNG